MFKHFLNSFSSAFGNQTVSIGGLSANYPSVYIKFIAYIGAANYGYGFLNNLDTNAIPLSMVGVKSSVVSIYYRNAYFKSGGITFGNGVNVTSLTTTSGYDNVNMVPLTIIGLKI